MKIDITVSDLGCVDPIPCAVARIYQKACFADNRYIVFAGNEKNPFRLPFSAEIFQINRARGIKGEPFSFEINTSV